MKNIRLNSLKVFIGLGMSILTSSLYSTGVYLENNYGATLNYRISQQKPEGERIGTNVRVFIGDINFIPELSIRATGVGSSYVSSYHDLNYLLKDIKFQQALHNNEDAIIRVGSSYLGWNITYTWENKGKGIKPFEYQDFPNQPVQPIKEISKEEPRPVVQVNEAQRKEENLMELTTADQRLNAIKNGALGPEYARKVTEICSANYTQAEKLGKINLCSNLQQNLIAPVYRIESRAQKRGINPDLAPAIEDIKTSINRLHNALAGYKTRGEAS